MADEEKPEEEQQQNGEEGEIDPNAEPKEEAPVLDEQEQKDLEEDKAEEEKDKEEEQVLDEEGNPVPNAGPRNPLKPEMLRENLSNLAKTFDGLSYAFTKLDIHEKELDGLGEDINNYNLLREFICTNNKIKDISSLAKMSYMSLIDASINFIKDISFFAEENSFLFLTKLNLKQNKIKVLPKMFSVYLTEINLSENRIADCSQFTGLTKLKKLNLSQNKIKSCKGLSNCPNLDVLYLNQNRIKSLVGIENLPNLRKLRLKTNRIKVFDYLPDLPKLQKLTISENQIESREEFAKLCKYDKLFKITLETNPYFDSSGVTPKTEVIIQMGTLKHLKFVNKEQLIKEDYEEAARTLQERKEKEEEERKQREEEERQRKEEEERIRKEKEEEERLKREEEFCYHGRT